MHFDLVTVYDDFLHHMVLWLLILLAIINFWFRKLSVNFRRFKVFFFSFWKPRKVLFCSFLKVSSLFQQNFFELSTLLMLFTTLFYAFSVFLTKPSKYCSNIEDLIVVLFNLAARPELDIESRCGHLQIQNGNDVPNWSLFTSFLVIVFVSHWKF